MKNPEEAPVAERGDVPSPLGTPPSLPMEIASSNAPSRPGLQAFAIFALVAASLFWRTLWSWLQVSLNESLHSHTLLVPFVTAYLIWIRRSLLPQKFATSVAAAIPFFGVGFICVLAADFQGSDTSDQLAVRFLAFLSFLAFAVLIFLGKQYFRSILFPATFLLFAIPLPDRLVDALETGSKLLSAEAAELFFSLTGTTYMREGNTFVLPGITLEVAQECSGIRSSLVLLVTGAFASNLLLRTNWRRWFLISVVIPLGILRNGFRILTIGLLCIHIGPHMVHSSIHHRGGPVFFVLSLIPLLAVVWWLRRGESKKVG